MTFETGLSSSRQGTPIQPTSTPGSTPTKSHSASLDLAREILACNQEPSTGRAHCIEVDPSKTEPHVTKAALSQLNPEAKVIVPSNPKGTSAPEFPLLKSPLRSPLPRRTRINSAATPPKTSLVVQHSVCKLAY